MLVQLKLKNFRCFKDYEVEFDRFNIIVGKNNTGKSTIIDALKLVSNVRRYAAYRTKGTYGYYIEERDIPFSLINLRHNYADDEDSIIDSKFSDNTEVEITFPVDGRPSVNFTKDRLPITDHKLLRLYSAHSIGIIPAVATFEESEKLGNKKYLQSILVSHLTARHFRNIWHYFEDGFEEFQEIIEETWPECTIERPEFYVPENVVCMFFRENNVTREIYWAGHGFQIWLQLMTYLIKLGRMETLILDEPDIYLHSDMQRKLINICKKRSNQVIIATHAVDIIEEGDPEDIISIDKNSNAAIRLSSIDEVQTCITQMGSFMNLKLVHFIRGKSCLFVEGEDFKHLKVFAKNLEFETFTREDGFSVIPLEGFSNWDRLLYIDWLFKNTFGERIKCYVILDRDYYTGEKIDEIIDNLQQKSVKVHVWERKEIENYAINEDALYRMFKDKFRTRNKSGRMPLLKANFKNKMISIFENLKNDARSQIIAQAINTRSDKSIHESTIISEVSSEFENNWKNVEFRRNVIGGKDFFAQLNTWLNKQYHVTIPFRYAIRSLRPDEIEPEIRHVLNEFIQLVNS